MRAVIKKTGNALVSLTAKTDYYPFGEPMPNKHTTDGNYRYAFQGQEKDPETGMEAFELRLWDGRLGRWLTVDPYHEFHSPYVGMGNNTMNLIDPDGGMTEPNNGDPFSNINLPGKSNFEHTYGGMGGKPLTKGFLIDFVGKNICPECTSGQLQNRTGYFFEELFEQFLDDEYVLDDFRVFKNPGDKYLGDKDYSVPDFLGVKYSNRDKNEKKSVEITTFYEIEKFYELKATKNNVGKSSFDGQIKTQIQIAKKYKARELVIITTSGVKLTKPLRQYALKQGVLLTHYKTHYTITNNKMKTNYVQVIY